MIQDKDTFCYEERECEDLNRNSLFLRGTTFESSTCDYSDDLQILLESAGRKQTEIKWSIPNRKHSKRTLADNTDQHILTTSSHIKDKFIAGKGTEMTREKKQFGYSCGRNSFRRDMSISINRHFWSAGRGRGGLKGRERWGGKGKLSVRWLPHAYLSPPFCWPAHIDKMQKNWSWIKTSNMMIHPMLSEVFSLVSSNCAM